MTVTRETDGFVVNIIEIKFPTNWPQPEGTYCVNANNATVGNSMGLTFPDKLKKFGAKIGKEVKIEALGPKSFKVELVG